MYCGPELVLCNASLVDEEPPLLEADCGAELAVPDASEPDEAPEPESWEGDDDVPETVLVLDELACPEVTAGAVAEEPPSAAEVDDEWPEVLPLSGPEPIPFAQPDSATMNPTT